MDDVAEAANVSKPTVSRALGGHKSVSTEKREKILKVARELGYVVNRNAQKLRQTHTNTVAVILDLSSYPRQRISDPFIFELLAGVSEALSIRKQDLLLSPSGLVDAESYRELVRSRVVDGYIFLGQGRKEKLLLELADLHVPFVVWGGQSQENKYCSVGSDNFLGGLLVGQRFVKHERKNILFIGLSDHLEIRLRKDGLEEGMATANYEYTIQAIDNEGFSFNDSHQSMESYLVNNPAPDGIFAYSDTAAMAAITVLNQKGLVPIQDYSMVGYNDIAQASHSSPPLTTIKQDTFLAGSLLVEKYMSLVNGHQPLSSTIPTELIIRNT
jgi:DNA-binding LacI/PurR family transcriptional regulator